MKTTTLAAAFLTVIAGDAFGQTVSTALTSRLDTTASVVNVGISARQPNSGSPGGSGILIGTAIWTAAGMSAQFASDVRLGQGATMQPALGRGLAFGREKP